MIRGANLVEQYQQVGPQEYPHFWREALGLQEDGTLDRAKAHVDPRDISIGELAMSFLGVHPLDELPKLRSLDLVESGAIVLPSTFGNISAFRSTITGLLEALIMEGYQAPGHFGDQVVTTYPTVVSGGRMIGIKNTGAEANQEALPPGEKYPMVGLDEDWVEIPELERRGIGIQITDMDIIHDRTATIQDKCLSAGDTLLRLKERRIARMVLGIDNTYVRGGVAANTYQAVAGASPNNHLNEAAIGPVVNYTFLDRARRLLGQQRDPYSDFEILISPQNAVIICSPDVELQFLAVIRTTQTERGARAANDIISTVAGNMLPVSYPILSSRIWSNVAEEGNYDKTTWWMGDMKRSFGYKECIPFEVVSMPISMEGMLSDVALAYRTREYGNCFVKEPRFTGRFHTEETD